MSERIPLEERLAWLDRNADFLPSQTSVDGVRQLIMHDYAEGAYEDHWTMSIPAYEHEIRELLLRFMLLELQLARGHELGEREVTVQMRGSTISVLCSLADWLGMRPGAK